MILAQQILDTPLGWMVISGTETHITQAQWVDEDELRIGHGTAPAPWKKEVQRQVQEYFEKKRIRFSLPLSPQGTEFQHRIWNEIQTIGYGVTKTYGEIIDTNHAQAVGGASGSNPILLLIPCHRLVGSDGRMTGYAGGMERKERLLQLEGAHLAQQLSLF